MEGLASPAKGLFFSYCSLFIVQMYGKEIRGARNLSFFLFSLFSLSRRLVFLCCDGVATKGTGKDKGDRGDGEGQRGQRGQRGQEGTEGNGRFVRFYL